LEEENMPNVKISLHESDPSKFYIETDRDVSMFGWKTERKFHSYLMEMSCWNLLDLYINKDRIGLELELDSRVEPIFEMLRNEMRKYNEAKKIKILSMTDINDMWEEEGFPRLFPKIEAEAYQKRMVLWLLAAQKACCFMEQGTGKTPTGVFLLGKLLHEKLVSKPIVFAPVSLLNNTAWFKDLERFTDFLPINLRVDREVTMKNEIHFVNYDKLQHWCFIKTKTAEHSYDKCNYFEREKFDAIFYDESSTLKTHSSYRSKAFVKISRHAKYIALASGTPSPSTIFQIWTQMRSIGSVLGDEYTPFEMRYGIQVACGPVKKWIPRTGANQEIRSRIDKVTYFIKRADVLDLPKRHYIDIDVDLCEEHMQLYKKIEKDYIAAVQGLDQDGQPLDAKVKAEHEIVARMRLLQVTSGFVTVENEDGDKQISTLLWNAKLDKLDEIAQKHLGASEDNHIIIWCRFRWEVDTIYNKYKDTAVYLYGGLSEAKRRTLLNRWLDDPTCKIMIAIPAAAKFGHTWLKANASIYFTGTDDYEDYSQSRDRNYRRGQDREVTEYKLITNKTIERKIWLAITTKQRLDTFLKSWALEQAHVINNIMT
jgi:SNF2 family DNA or RNA helicase